MAIASNVTLGREWHDRGVQLCRKHVNASLRFAECLDVSRQGDLAKINQRGASTAGIKQVNRGQKA